jgi:SPX domain protein involved in polyphosphate accumulation
LLTDLRDSLAAGAQYQSNQELLRLKEDEVREEGALLLSKTSRNLSQLAQLSLDDDDNAEDIDMESLKDLKKDIKQGKASVQEYKELLATVLVRYECLRMGVKVKDVKIQGKSKAAIGISNLEGKERKVTVNIDNVLVDEESSGMIGFHNNVDFKDFWGKSA